MEISVIIPTYNGAQRVPAVLDRLRSQITPTPLLWEVIVVDNNSHDDTAAVVRHYQATWRDDVPLRYVFEPRQGLAYARQCGVDQAQGALVGFLDDDNWPQPDWVAEAVAFAHNAPTVGAYGGKTQAAFDDEPEIPIQAIAKFLALQDYGPKPYRFQPERQILPAGAGLVVRREAWLACIPRQLVRISQGGDDYELSLRLAKHGWEIYYNPKMVIQHHIPKARLERDYLVKLTHGYGLCTCDLMMIDVPLWQQPGLLTKFFLGTLKRLVQHQIKFRRHPADLAAQCYLSFHLGNLKSPFRYVMRSLSSQFDALRKTTAP